MRVLSFALMLAGLLVFSWASPRYASYLSSHRPEAPNIASGQTLERKFRGGHPVYISYSDMFIEATIVLSGMALFAAGFTVFNRYYPPRRES